VKVRKKLKKASAISFHLLVNIGFSNYLYTVNWENEKAGSIKWVRDEPGKWYPDIPRYGRALGRIRCVGSGYSGSLETEPRSGNEIL
jgi:hypothetical protein